jgi:hypothetical protein
MPQLFTNNAWGTLASQLTAGATSLALTTGQGARFPSPTGGDYFLATLIGITGTAETSWEIVKCTARATDALTIVRAQEGTSDATWAAGTRVELRVTAATLTDVGQITTLAKTDGNIIVADGSKWVAESGATARTSLGLGTGNSPQFTAIELGAASDTTLARSAAGKVTIEGVEITTASNTQTLSNKTITGLFETKTAPSISAGTLTLDCAAGNVFVVALNANITTLSFSNVPATGTAVGITLELVADGTQRTITWGSAVKWPGGTAPTPTATNGKVDRVVLTTHNGGTTWYASTAGQNY